MGCQVSTFRFPSRRSRRSAPPRLPPPPPPPNHEDSHTPSGQQQRAAPTPPPPTLSDGPVPPPESYELENKVYSKIEAYDMFSQLQGHVFDWNSPPIYDVYPDRDDKPVGNKVTDQLRQDGLESGKLIIGFDFSHFIQTNERRDPRSFNRKSLHYIGAEQNPYEQAIAIICKTLSSFDEDNMIPCYGFGDASTDDQEVFNICPDEGACCNGYEEVIKRYREVVPRLQLGGPRSFAPIIEMATTIVEQSVGQYHVLVILADGQLSPQEKNTVEAIVKASEYPLSIVVVGVGDGPWDKMKKFERKIPQRAFKNFQFVNAADIFSKNMDSISKEVMFASAAFRQLPSQYKEIQNLGILGATRENPVLRTPLPPPCYTAGFVGSDRTDNNHVCPICLDKPLDMAFGCGHQTCCQCGQDLRNCPLCRTAINHRTKLYF